MHPALFRCRHVAKPAADEDALILRTQIARIYALRKVFAAARALLESIAEEAVWRIVRYKGCG
jgi:hypothetical protein